MKPKNKMAVVYQIEASLAMFGLYPASAIVKSHLWLRWPMVLGYSAVLSWMVVQYFYEPDFKAAINEFFGPWRILKKRPKK